MKTEHRLNRIERLLQINTQTVNPHRMRVNAAKIQIIKFFIKHENNNKRKANR